MTLVLLVHLWLPPPPPPWPVIWPDTPIIRIC